MSQTNEVEVRKDQSNDEVLQWVTFQLEEETYGINVMQVREVLRYTEIAPVPGAPDYVLGIINLRGNVVTVIDTRSRFGLVEGEITDNTRIIVIESEHQVIGILVDSVAEVVYLRSSEIDTTPSVGTDESAKFIQGVSNRDGKLLMDVEADVRLVSYQPGRITFEPSSGAPRDLAQRLGRGIDARQRQVTVPCRPTMTGDMFQHRQNTTVHKTARNSLSHFNNVLQVIAITSVFQELMSFLCGNINHGCAIGINTKRHKFSGNNTVTQIHCARGQGPETLYVFEGRKPIPCDWRAQALNTLTTCCQRTLACGRIWMSASRSIRLAATWPAR